MSFARLVRPLAAALVLGLGLGLGAVPAGAAPQQTSPDPVPGQSALPAGPAPAISPALDHVALVGAEHERAARRYDDTVAAFADAVALAEHHDATLLRLGEDEAELTEAVVEATDRRRAGEQALARVQRRVRDLAVQNYITGGDTDDVVAVLDLDAGGTNDHGRDRVLVGAVQDRTLGDLRRAKAELAAARDDVTRRTGARDEVRAEIDTTTKARDEARTEGRRLGDEVIRRLDEMRAARTGATVRGTELPLVVLDAYYKAAQHLAFDSPTCGISWWGLAGIGFIESGHGTFGGATVLPNGDLSRPIIGIPLNGSNNTAVIGDTDGGFYDGDTAFDRAVGPMQFIPSTWEAWKRDGNGDGRFDPQNMYDAAYSAAAYTCAGGPMRSDADLSRGYFSYNRDAAYVQSVLDRAKSYAGAVQLPAPAPLAP